MTGLIRILSWNIVTVHKGIAWPMRISLNSIIHIDKSAPLRVIVPTAQIIQPGLLVIHIATIPERIERSQRACHRAGFTQYPTPSIVLVFYYLLAVAVNQRDHIAL